MSVPRYKTVVVPIDFSEDSEPAIRSALSLVDDPAGLHVVHVLYPLSADASLHGLVPVTFSDETRRSAARDRLAELAKSLGAASAKSAILSGDAGLETADYAKQVGADLVVVPSHGYHGVKRFLLGSTAERIIRHAHCSVLVLRRHDAE